MWKYILIIFVIVLILMVLAYIVISKISHKNKDQTNSQANQFLDRLTTKPAEISIRTIESFVNQTIEKYLSGYYNLNPQLLPVSSMTQELYSKIFNDMKRQYDLGIRNQLIAYTPLERYKIKQNNSAIYAVTELKVTCHYTVEYTSCHSTFDVVIKKSVSQVITFVFTNMGYALHEIGPEIIEKKEESPRQLA